MTQPYESFAIDDKPAQPVHKRPWFVVIGGLAAVGVLGALIGDSSTDEPSATPPSASPTSESRPPARSSASTVPVAPSPTEVPTLTPTETAADLTAVSFVMPDVVGMDLQSGQNLVQTYGVFLTVSHDLRGSRNQALDSNWLICDQNIPPGQQVTGDVEGQIDFGVVKREESCP